MNSSSLSLVYAFITIGIWSTVATAFVLGLRGLDPYQLILVAAVVALLVLLLIQALRGRLAEFKSVGRADIRRALVLGAFNPVLYYILLFKGYEILPAQVAQPVNYTWTITLTLLAVPFLKQKLNRLDLAGMIVGYFGLVVIATGGRPVLPEKDQLIGIVYILAGTVIWAGYWLCNVKSRLSPLTTLCLNFACALPWALAACLVFSELPLNPALWPSLLAAAYVGASEMGLAFVTWLMALKLSSSAARLGSLVFLAPFISLIWISLILGEEIALSSVLGLGLIVAGALLQRIKSRPAAGKAKQK